MSKKNVLMSDTFDNNESIKICRSRQCDFIWIGTQDDKFLASITSKPKLIKLMRFCREALKLKDSK